MKQTSSPLGSVLWDSLYLEESDSLQLSLTTGHLSFMSDQYTDMQCTVGIQSFNQLEGFPVSCDLCHSFLIKNQVVGKELLMVTVH